MSHKRKKRPRLKPPATIGEAKSSAERKKLRNRLRSLAKEGRVANGVELPAGAIPADLARQAPNNSWGPPLYYVDQPFRCVDCGVEQVWTATQQKWYFEVAKGSIYGRAKRCRACRRKHKSGGKPQ
ncbi:MAG: zinc-ribbon domain containing protein [Pirellulales bacterium]